MKKIVVLGANSFSGQDFVDLCLDTPDYHVTGISRSPQRSDLFLKYLLRGDLSHYNYHQLDINDDIDLLLKLLDEIKPSWIINFAAQSEVAPSWDNPDHWFQTNTVALAKLVNHLRHQDYLERYLHISSPEAYGTCHGNVDESTPDNPSTPYAASKAAADMLLSVYRDQYNFPLQTVRATNVYGARQQLFKIIPRSIIYIKQNRKIQLHGGGVAVKSYIHVRDVSLGELAILQHGRVGELYHISPDNGISIRKLVELICQRMGVVFEDCVEIVSERPGQDDAYLLDSNKARSELNWEPSVDLNRGIEEAVKWVGDYWGEIEKQTLEYVHLK